MVDVLHDYERWCVHEAVNLHDVRVFKLLHDASFTLKVLEQSIRLHRLKHFNGNRLVVVRTLDGSTINAAIITLKQRIAS